jgi:plastocyanin
MNVGHGLRIAGAFALLVAGLVHLDLYFGGYRSAGSVPAFGRSILLNAIISAVLAVAVAARREWFVRLAGIAVPVATLAAFTYTHHGHAFLGFEGKGLDPSPQAQTVLLAEIAAIVLLAATFLPQVAERGGSGGVRELAVVGVATAVVFVGFGWYWADKYETTDASAAPTSVTIAGFAFRPQTLTVPRGATVTWTNVDGVEHSVFASDHSFSSDWLSRGAAFAFTFDTVGEHAYVCDIHPDMTGTITVTA